MSEAEETMRDVSAITIDQETAEAEFERFVDAWEIDGEVETMNEESRDGFEQHQRTIVRAIKQGRLLFDDEARATIKLPNTTEWAESELTLKVPTGAAMLKWDNYKEGKNVHKMNAMLGAMSGKNPAVFPKIDARDLKPAMAVATLFLAS